MEVSKRNRKYSPKSQWGGGRSAFLEEKPDATIDEILKKLITKCGKKAKFSRSALKRFFKRHGYTRKKKTCLAAEQSRPDVEKEQADFIDKFTESGRVLLIRREFRPT